MGHLLGKGKHAGSRRASLTACGVRDLLAALMSTMEDSSQSFWNACYAIPDREADAVYEPWLDPWIRGLKPGAALDIGCGHGRDSQVLNRLGWRVTAIDFATEALVSSRRRNPGVEHLQRDLREGLRLEGRRFALIVANLSLHYFDRAQSQSILGQIHSSLEPDGHFLFRVNAVGDPRWGCPEEIQPWQTVMVKGQIKQFFSESMIREWIADSFDILSLRELEPSRYGMPKRLWETVARRR